MPTPNSRSLTDAEAAAIRLLRRAERSWPGTLKIQCDGGGLHIVPNGVPMDELTEDDIIESITGIPNDGGDPW